MSNVRAYVKDEIKDHDKYEEKREPGGDKRYFHRILLWASDEGMYFHVDEFLLQIPDVIKEFVKEITFFNTFPAKRMARRELGIYRYSTASAEIDIYSSDSISVRIKGKKLEDVRALYRLIRAGLIRPLESWEGGQIGHSRIELEEEYAEAVADRGELSKRIIDLEAEIKKGYETLQQLRSEVRGGSTWWCSRSRVVSRLNEAIGNQN